MKALKQILKNFLKSLGVQYRKYDPADPLNVPREWVGWGNKAAKPERIVIGGGDMDYGPRWHNIEFVTPGYATKYKSLPANTDIAHDLTANKPLPIDSDTIEAAYTSHVIEHLQDEHVAYIFSETCRVLKSGGVFRITCPDIDLYIRAFMDKDLSFFHYRDHYHYVETGINQSVAGMFLDVFATSIAQSADYQEIAESFKTRGVVPTLEFYKSKVVYDVKRSHFHVNWFNVEKLKAMLKRAGFFDIRVSAMGQSYYSDMRNLSKFDTQDFKISLFVECVK